MQVEAQAVFGILTHVHPHGSKAVTHAGVPEQSADWGGFKQTGVDEIVVFRVHGRRAAAV